ncbi:octapeptide-repeat protein T2-like [Polyergus mexicanus]|uniref:octapeptide-repeat protein T2-like n=2 Tax=Polyergus mexicanus TaxID=615972 RepID=UPI0038B4EE4A
MEDIEKWLKELAVEVRGIRKELKLWREERARGRREKEEETAASQEQKEESKEEDEEGRKEARDQGRGEKRGIGGARIAVKEEIVTKKDERREESEETGSEKEREVKKERKKKGIGARVERRERNHWWEEESEEEAGEREEEGGVGRGRGFNDGGEKNEMEDGRKSEDGKRVRKKRGASDCFELSRQSYHNRDYYHMVVWMQEAMDRLQGEQNATTTSKPDILEYLAFSTYK